MLTTGPRGSYGLYVLHLVFLPSVTFLLLDPLRGTLLKRFFDYDRAPATVA